MDRDSFWDLIEQARAAAGDDADAELVVREATALLSRRPAAEIMAAAQAFWDIMADSYRVGLWGAAYLINGGCSDDGFEYFRGWLITQGRWWYERAVADPDVLAEHPAVQAALAEGDGLELEDTLGIAWDAYLAATGSQLPPGAFTIRYPDLVFDWDFDDAGEERRRLPRLSALEDADGQA